MGERSLDRRDHVSCILQIYNYSSAFSFYMSRLGIACIALRGTSDPLLLSFHSRRRLLSSFGELKFSIVE
ncbi:hypothetical protein VNO77_21952 [Canavalia gladiata]|uniref:Uncharacterized protein n=1 Tax=Canavalia gladiata TaxID=3824 RepID=A0AAN9QAL0_CANGL